VQLVSAPGWGEGVKARIPASAIERLLRLDGTPPKPERAAGSVLYTSNPSTLLKAAAGGDNVGGSTSPSSSVGISTPSQTSTTVESQEWIQSPSKNIQCQIIRSPVSAAGVICQTTIPPQQVSMTTTGAVTKCAGSQCLGDAGDNVPRTLAYGDTTTLGSFTCTSLQTGLSCAVPSGKGFTIARAGITSVGSWQAPTPTSANSPTASCGTMHGGGGLYSGTLTVKTTPGVSCSAAIAVFNDMAAEHSVNHEGPDSADSYLTVDGWNCPYGNMGIQTCWHRNDEIVAAQPGTL
jgi:hypothetical protein